jgi:hypothetical protein
MHTEKRIIESFIEFNKINENVDSDIEKLKKFNTREKRYEFIKDFSKDRLINIADKLDIDYEDHDDLESRVLNCFD